MPAAMTLPWEHADGTPATADEIAIDWKQCKLTRMRGHLVLSADAVNKLVQARLQQNEVYLARRWAHWESFPADAQLACHSCAWAAGAAWHAPHLDAGLAIPDFSIAAGPLGDASSNSACRGEAWLNDTGNPGLRPRNLANKVLFHNADCVTKWPTPGGTDPEQLYWPAALSL
jgi:hypothetical protein